MFSDPAGAKACLAYAEIQKRTHPNSVTIEAFSNKHYDFYADWSTPVTISSDPDILFGSNPDWIFAGTSHPESSNYYELELIKEAGLRGIPVESFIDHWTCIRLRYLDKSGEAYFPPNILVVNEHAKELAIQYGIPEVQIRILENPYLTYIANFWKPTFGKEALFQKVGHPSSTIPFILYAPDPLSLRIEDEMWGFTEASALQTILNCLPDQSIPIYVKEHPLQPAAIMDEILLKNKHYQIIRVQGINNLELMHAADVIIGFHSNFLLEAQALQKKTYRFQIGFDGADPFMKDGFGTVIKSTNQLTQILTQQHESY